MISSDNAMRILLLAYFVIGIICITEKNYPRALYWASAGLLTISILWGMK